jgi:glycine cleavage system aminomethyltransferase T
VAGHEILALRQGMSGELGGFELQGPKGAIANEVREAILDLGREIGIRRLGSRSAMINHLEAWYPTINQHYLPAIFGDQLRGFREYLKSAIPVKQGFPDIGSAFFAKQSGLRNVSGSYEAQDISEYYRSPLELGWRKNIKFDHEFLGSQALQNEIANPKRVGVTLEFNSDDIITVFASFLNEGEHFDFMEFPHWQRSAMHASKIMKNDMLVGFSTMPAYSYYFRKMLSISCIDATHSRDGEDVEVIWGEPGHRQIALKAKVREIPYKKDKRRAAL